MADMQLPGPNHKEANCIPNELVRYSGVTTPISLLGVWLARLV